MNLQKLHYLKQYTCYQFTNYIANTPKPKITMKLKSEGKDNWINNTLRNQVLDSFGDNDKLYILKWQFRNTNSTIVDIFPFNSLIFNRIQMDQRPSFITIIDKHIYLIIGSSLQIIRYQNMALEKTHILGTDIIHAVQPAFSQVHYNELGVYIYSWNQKKGYNKRFYSLFSENQQKWWSSLVNINLFESRPLQLRKSTLKVLIPNVIGVIIQDSSTILLINLKSMQLIQRCNRKLTQWSITNPNKCIIKYYINTRSQGYDDCLLISIGQKDKQFIELFVFHIKYLRSIAQKYNQENNIQISIRTTQSGEIIDWDRSNLSSLLTFSTEGGLIDYLLTSQGIIYYSNTKSMIPTAGFSYYQNPLHINPILPLEHNICSSYLIDNQIYTQMEQLTKQITQAKEDRILNQLRDQFHAYESKLVNSMLRPNRYSKSFISASTETNSLVQIFNFSKLKPIKMLLDWYKSFKVKSIYLLNDDIIVVRENAITSLLPITTQQYKSQYQNPNIFQQVMNKISQGQPIKSMYSFQMSINSSKYSMNRPQIIFGQLKQNWWGEMNQMENNCFSYERLGTRCVENQDPNQYEYMFQQYVQKLLQKIDMAIPPSLQIEQKGLITNKSIIFAKSLVMNRVKDLILFYSKIIRYTFIKSSQTNSTAVSNGFAKKEKNIVNYLSMLQSILADCSRQHLGLGCDLLGKYIEQNVNQLLKNINKNEESNKNQSQANSQNRQNRQNLNEDINIIIDVQKQSWKIIKNIFADIIVKQDVPQISINGFIKLLIETFGKGYSYIGNLFLNTFNPHQSIFPLDYDLDQQQLFGRYDEPFTSWSNQQSQFPLTPTLLMIYSCLDIPNDAKKTLFTCFIIKNLSNKEDQKLFNRILNNIPVNEFMKQKVREIYLQIKGLKEKQPLDQKSSKQYGSSDTQNKSLKNIKKLKQQIDNSRGIIQITKVLQPDELQRYLLQLPQKQLQIIFRINIQNMLDQNLQGNDTIKASINGQSYTSEDYLMGWIMKYRVYVIKFNKWIQMIQQHASANQSSEDDFDNVKKAVLECVRNCYHSLKNVRKYYQDLYKTKNIRQKLQNCITVDNINQIETDEQIIQKVCCRMIGFDDVEQLYLYERKVKLISHKGQEGNAQRILPTIRFLQLIIQILKDGQAHVFVLQNIKTVLYYYLKNVLQNPKQQNLDYFKMISKYFTRQFISKFIQKTGVLRQLYINLPDTPVGRQIKGYFGYCQIQNIQKLGLSANRINLKNTQKQGSNKVSKNSSRDSQNVNRMQQQRNNNSNLQFRNAYLEAIGR